MTSPGTSPEKYQGAPRWRGGAGCCQAGVRARCSPVPGQIVLQANCDKRADFNVTPCRNRSFACWSGEEKVKPAEEDAASCTSPAVLYTTRRGCAACRI